MPEKKIKKEKTMVGQLNIIGSVKPARDDLKIRQHGA
jgi:hypothetical protein